MSAKRSVKFILDIFASKISLLILGSLTVWLGASVAKEAYRKHQVKQEVEKLKLEILDLERKNNNISSIIDSFQDPKTVELEAKRRLNLKKPGEGVAVILRDKNDESQNIVQTEPQLNGGEHLTDEQGNDTVSPAETNPVRWWRYITDD